MHKETVIRILEKLERNGILSVLMVALFLASIFMLAYGILKY
jgi:hypothetical protein